MNRPPLPTLTALSGLLAGAFLVLAAQQEIPLLLSSSQDTVRPAVRDARAVKFNSRYPFSMLEPIPGRIGKPSKTGSFVAGPELPFREVDTIVTGQVIRVQPFLSADRKAIYTEYTIKVTDAIKTVAGASPAVGDSLTLLSEGGAARSPEGRVLEHLIVNDITPAMRKNYLFFLLNAPALEGFHYIKFWLIEQGVLKPVIPPDVELARRGNSMFAGKPVSDAIDFLKANVGR